MAKFKLQLNSIDNLSDLLQQTLTEADSQIIQAQNEINKLTHSTKLEEEIMDAKSKYAKAISDYLKIKDMAIKTKIEICKIMNDVNKVNGNLDNMDDSQVSSFNGSLDDIIKLTKQSVDAQKDAEKKNSVKIDIKKNI